MGAAPPRALRGVVPRAVPRVRRARPRVPAGVYVLGDAGGSGGAVGLWVSLVAWVCFPLGTYSPGMTFDMDSVWSLAHAALRRRRFGRGIRSYYRGMGGERPGTPPHLMGFPAAAPRRGRRTSAWRKWTAATATRRHEDEEGGLEGFTPRVGGMPPPSASLPLRERVERTQQRQRLEKRRQPSLHSTASTACDKGEAGEEKGLGGVEEKEEGAGAVEVPGRVVVKM